ncbi:enoyl-CoA hydratase/isomerase family protein [Pueribacillus sp. YX66]|uniref:enoyl-CoA hydratase/isomerase family protein n=1 Tax=Pueribacillus sp. YX66 TaxID=3229242 RepID=UPI00358D8258
MESTVKLKSISDGMGHIILNRPKSLNALNEEMLYELLEKLTVIENTSSYKTLIISGSGDNFAAGADLKQISEMDAKTFENYVRLIQEVTWKLEKIPILTIAAIQGVAYGGGLELALSCDFRFATPDSRFALPEIRLGLIPGGGGTYRLTKLIGLAKAKKMLYTGSVIRAEEALQVGLLEKITSEDHLIEETIEFSNDITKKSAVAFRAIKESASHAFDVDTYAARQMEVQAILSVFSGDDCKEGIQAFIEKREPQFIRN